MAQQINLKELERKAWQSFYQDGVWDIFLGLLLMAFAVSALLSALDTSNGVRMTLFLLTEGIAVAWMVSAKHYITVPRLGQATFKKQRKRNLWVIFILGIAVLGGLVAFVALGRGSDTLINTTTMPILWALNCIVLFGLLAYLLDFNRLMLIGLLFAVTVPVDQYLFTRLTEANIAYLAFGIPALIILGIGVVIFIRFLRDYPVVRPHE